MILDLILLDRDGVINENHPRCITKAENFHLIPGAAQGISMINQLKVPVAVVTNQAGVGRGDFPLEELHRIHQKMQDLLAAEGAHINGLYYCTDVTIEPHFRRKPAPGMLKEAMTHFKARPAYTVMIGDSLRDLQAAQGAECQRILVRTGHGLKTELSENFFDVAPVNVFKDLLEATKFLCL